MRNATTVAAIMVVALGAAAARGETLFTCGFETSEGYSDGYLVASDDNTGSSNQQNWYGGTYTTSPGTTNDAVVSTTRAHSDDRSLKIPKEDNFYDWYAHDFTAKTTGLLTVEWYMYLDNADTNPNPAGANNSNNLIHMINDGTFGHGDWYTKYAAPAAADHWYYPSGGVYENDLNETDVSAAGQWNGRRIVFNIDEEMFDIHTNVGGAGWNLKVNDAAYYDSFVSQFSAIMFYQMCGAAYFDNTSYNAYMDDILVTWVPEPATIGLLGLGGLVVVLRHRRRWRRRGVERRRE